MATCTFPVDTGRKLNVHKTFRRRLGRLLNVLCTFNLSPVSTGFSEEYLGSCQTSKMKDFTKIHIGLNYILDFWQYTKYISDIICLSASTHCSLQKLMGFLKLFRTFWKKYLYFGKNMGIVRFLNQRILLQRKTEKWKCQI